MSVFVPPNLATGYGLLKGTELLAPAEGVGADDEGSPRRWHWYGC